MIVSRTEQELIQELNTWKAREQEYIDAFGATMMLQKELLKEKLRFYESVYREEKLFSPYSSSPALRLLRKNIEQLKMQVYPSRLERLFHDLFSVFRISKQEITDESTYRVPSREKTSTRKSETENQPNQLESISKQQKIKTMNEQNFDYLAKQLKYTGFGEELQRELREKMAEGETSFYLNHQAKFGEVEVSAMLQFKKSEQSDMYFFNRYFLQLPGEKKEEALAQSFRIDRENNITLKEGFNLLQGRAIYKELQPKEGEKYHAWLQLNFKETNEYGDFKMKQFHENYGYRITDTLARYPIKELENTQSTESLIKSLERGNRQQVTMLQDGKETKLFIEASPQFKSLNVYNAEGLRTNIRAEKLGHGAKQSEKHAEKLQQKEGMAGGEKKTKRQSQDQGLNGQENGSIKHAEKRGRRARQGLS